MLKTVVYEGENILGEVEILFEKKSTTNWNNGGVVEDKEYEYDVEILRKGLKISELSKGGERCHPLAVLHTICSSSSSNCVGFCFKMIEHKSLFYHQQHHQQQDSSLLRLHSTCIRENKTAVVPFGEQEIHLVAMRSTRIDTRIPCFWGFIVAPGLYESCLGMLNLRCLGIVFDLDETLIVANTLRSFEDRIDALQRKISAETDSQRVAGMVAEVKRYQDDKAILKQYAETDQVVDNGKVHKIQAEVVPALSDNHQTVVRPLIRLQDKNIVLTRINPQIRDTSVLVRLRPAWEDLRSYLTARGRKRFEVYVCTMAERDYALEMWRLLDPDSNLISTGEVLDRIVCVKSGSKKSLFNVFHDGICHPKMALVIDDRLKVWDDEDQPRVHVVPAFAPYYAPQAEANNAIPVLCVARNVACNVRGGFFKDFDDILLQRILEVSFEDDIRDVPSPPDVSNYLVSEDDGTGTNSNKEALCFDGMADAEVERRLKEAVLASSAATSLPSAPSSASINVEPRLQSSLSFPVAAPSMMIPQPAQTLMTSFPANLFSQAGSLVRPLGNLVPQELTLRSSPAPEEGEVSESEVDPDTRRRLLILQHGQDFRDNLQIEAPFSIRPAAPTPTAGPAPVPGALPVAGPGPGPGSVPAPIPAPGPGPGLVPRMQSRGSWFPVDDHMNPGHLNRTAGKEFPIGPDSLHMEKQRPPPFQRRMENPVRSDRSFPEKQRPPREAPRRDDRIRHSLPNHQSYQGDDLPLSRSSSNKEFEVVPKRGNSLPESPAAALHVIAVRCGTKVEFRSGLVASTELRFLMEAYFSGERIGEGAGAKRREAQHRAAEAALMNLADRYLIHVKSDSSPPQSDTSRGQSPSNTGYPGDANSPVDRALIKDEVKPAAEVAKQDDPVLDEPKESDSSVLALKELCMKEGLVIDFRAPSPSRSPISNIQGDEIYAEAKIDGQVFGKGAGSTWDEAKIQAADQALASLKSTLGQSIHKRPASPRLVEGMPIKRLKPDLPQVLQRLPSSRYPRNASPVP